MRVGEWSARPRTSLPAEIQLSQEEAAAIW
jgi:hypothetical protein